MQEPLGTNNSQLWKEVDIHEKIRVSRCGSALFWHRGCDPYKHRWYRSRRWFLRKFQCGSSYPCKWRHWNISQKGWIKISRAASYDAVYGIFYFIYVTFYRCMPGSVLIQFFFCPVVSACTNNILTCKHDDFQFRCLIFRHAYHLLFGRLKFCLPLPFQRLYDNCF